MSMNLADSKNADVWELNLIGRQKKMHKIEGRQEIMVFIEKTQYNRIKKQAKEYGLTLGHYAGLILSGYKIEKQAIATEK